MKLLLHCCCAPCSIGCVEALAGEGLEPALFWYNPNIHPMKEYLSRLESLLAFAEEKELSLLDEGKYVLHSFIENTVSSLDKAEEKNNRCHYCYKTRLELCAIRAAETGCDGFSTTLLISPYQDHEEIKRLGNEIASLHGLEFLYRDFRPHFRESQKQARALSFYMQKYCGCLFSEKERRLEKKK